MVLFCPILKASLLGAGGVIYDINPGMEALDRRRGEIVTWRHSSCERDALAYGRGLASARFANVSSMKALLAQLLGWIPYSFLNDVCQTWVFFWVACPLSYTLLSDCCSPCLPCIRLRSLPTYT